jgi:regulator of replication initiation timing
VEKLSKANSVKMLKENKLLLEEIDHLKRQLTEARRFRARTPTRKYNIKQFGDSHT